jgi:hypothetical protein
MLSELQPTLSEPERNPNFETRMFVARGARCVRAALDRSVGFSAGKLAHFMLRVVHVAKME